MVMIAGLIGFHLPGITRLRYREKIAAPTADPFRPARHQENTQCETKTTTSYSSA